MRTGSNIPTQPTTPPMPKVKVYEPTIPTMTLHELTAKMRALGIPTSEATLADGIEQGQYPFAICIKRKNRQFEIYSRLFDKWISERSV